MLAEIENSDSTMSITFTAEQAMAQQPQFHITPQFGWMNDPNGMFQLGALYHIFFQYNPAAGKYMMSALHCMLMDCCCHPQHHCCWCTGFRGSMFVQYQNSLMRCKIALLPCFKLACSLFSVGLISCTCNCIAYWQAVIC